ncbi:MAG: amidohydrolase family protein [Candidatus Kerfeldbacteria bacterium]|nr:amidohydrolase family protein [Candidatus Kerfeldbacteria bacterium]
MSLAHLERYRVIRPITPPRRILVSNIPYIITTNDRNDIVILQKQSLYIERGVIQALLPAKQDRRYHKTVDVIYNAGLRSGIVVTPGLINAHAHPPMYLLRSTTLLKNEHDTTEQALVLARRIEQAMSLTDQTIASLGDFTEQQKMGTTTVLSHYHSPQATRAAAQQAHIRLVDAVSLASKTDPAANLRSAVRVLTTGNPLIRPGLTIHTLAQVTRLQLQAVRRVLQQHRQTILTIHCGETATEIAACVERHGQRPVAVLHQAGLLGPRLILSHAVHLTADEIALLVKRRVGIVHLPTSNRIHRSGQFQWPEFFAWRGHHRIALGTDSVISKSKLDIISEAFQSKIMHQDTAEPIHYTTLFRMMTINGARILGLEHSVGRVWPGYQADLAFWKLKDRDFIPFDPRHPETLLGNMINHAGGNVRDLMVHGRFVISNRRHTLVDESALLTQLQQHHIALRKRLKQ